MFSRLVFFSLNRMPLIVSGRFRCQCVLSVAGGVPWEEIPQVVLLLRESSTFGLCFSVVGYYIKSCSENLYRRFLADRNFHFCGISVQDYNC